LVPTQPPKRDSAVVDTAPRREPRRLPSTIPDSLLRPPISPKAAFLHSLALPGWGQSALRRSTAATVFAAAEIGALFMVAKSHADLKRARALQGLDSVTVGDPSLGEAVTRVPAVPEGLVNARRLHLEDWIAALLFNHLIAGADAYVAANLWDLPARVSIRRMPEGMGLSAQFRF
ncbi:MAG TPA: hypothetical protein VE861_05610, partial [Gemmatimonadaceae bacterium]|nr:hypothetical protein [Gemmatimonadaceae bacterium]